MSKIKIEQVDSLDEKEVVRYEDLVPGTAFKWVSGHDELRLKIEDGNIDPVDGTRWGDGADGDKEVIPVDAKIIWAHKGGE